MGQDFSHTPFVSTVQLATSSPFIIGYLKRRGLMAGMLGLGASAMSAQLLRLSYYAMAKPFRHVILPLSGGTPARALFLTDYRVQVPSLYAALFSVLLGYRFPNPFFLAYWAILRRTY
jgi:hypothetical protein